MRQAPAAEQGGRDWQPWAILAMLAVVLTAIVWLTHPGERPLAKRTAESGLPLTSEQKSVDFQAADLSFEVLADSERLNGRAVLSFMVKAPIRKLQFDLDPELPISRIDVDGARAGPAGLGERRRPRHSPPT